MQNADIITILLGLLITVFGLFLHQKKKADTANIQSDEDKLKESLKAIDDIVSGNNAQLSQEEQNRQNLEKQAEEKKDAPKSQDELLGFLNDPNKPNN